MAALNFPANPSNGDQFEGYVYDSTLGVWNRKPSTVAYTVSANAPTNPNDGDVWFNEQDGSSYIYYVDTDSEQWIEIGGKVGATGAAGQNGADGRFTNSATKPTSPVDGDVWFNTNNGKIFVYYDDGDTAQWVESGNPTLGYNTLENLSDTNITSPTDGQALVYNTSTSKWIPGDVSVDVYDVTNSSTGYLSIPKGTDAQRPQNPVNGDLRFNTESGEPEWYSEAAGQWIKFRLSPSQDFEYLVIAGGGGAGGYYSGGGGGAGGYRSSVIGQLSGGLSPAESTLSFAAGDSFMVQIGAGGVGGTGVGDASSNGSKGSNSVLGSIVSIGGGAGPWGGQSLASSIKDGGSGGGASGNVPNNIGGLGTTGQGFNGGNASTDINSNYSAAGGGGAGEAGEDAGNVYNGAGGDGIFSNITGTSVQRGGGGGAGSHSATFGGPGGAGGGGAGGLDGGNNSGFSGSANTGGGGGGAHYESSTGASGGSGGSGIVIIRYPATLNLTIGGGLTSVTTVVGDKKVTQFTAGTDMVTVG